MSEARGEVLMRPYLDTPDRKTAVPEMLEEAMKLTGDRCRCGACGELFRRTYAFDMHRVGAGAERRCLTPAEMAGKRMVKDGRGFWMQASRFTGRSKHAFWQKHVARNSGDLSGVVPEGQS